LTRLPALLEDCGNRLVSIRSDIEGQIRASCI